MKSLETKLAPGILIGKGRYQIKKPIGSGGMGAVYEATQVAIGRKVAVKQLHPVFSQNEEVIARFQREAQMAGSIGHDNICEVTDLGTTKQGAPYLVMPLLNGHSLDDLISSREQLTVPRLADIICQTLSALEAAHNAKIVHRDLKPDNIFVTQVGDRDDFVKLLDFGISKIIDQDSVSNLTRTGTVLGTPYYMAPEQARGDKTLDHRIDIYAIGVIMYEALTGQRPFEGDSYNKIMYSILTEPFPSPCSLNTSISAEVEQVILKAMSRDPAERFTNAHEMREALKQTAVETGISINTPRMTQAHTSADIPAENRPFTPTQTNAASSSSSADLSTNGDSVLTLAVPSGRSILKIAVIAIAALLVAISVIALLVGNKDTKPEIVVPITPAKSESQAEVKKELLEKTEPTVQFPKESPENKRAIVPVKATAKKSPVRKKKQRA